jgi:hypothetical protein
MGRRSGGRVSAVSASAGNGDDIPRTQDNVRETLGLSVRLRIDQIRRDGGTQPRAQLSEDVIADYAEEMKRGAKFPPVVIFHDGTNYWLADGFHRVGAAKLNGDEEISADIRQGTLRDAILFSVGVNATHGLRRTNEDKRRAVMALLDDEEWRVWVNTKIAEKCHVSESFVRNLRNSNFAQNEVTERTFTTKHGTVAKMKTKNIGKSENKRRQESEPELAVQENDPEYFVRIKRRGVIDHLYGAAEDLLQLGLSIDAKEVSEYAQRLADEWGMSDG